MIRIIDWVALIPEEDKHLAYVGENEADTRQFLLTGEDARIYRDWGFHLDMAFDLSTVTRTDTHRSETTQKNHKESITETQVTLDSCTTKEIKDVVDVEVDCTSTTDVAYLFKEETEEGLLLTWTICRQQTLLPGKLQATLRAMSSDGQVKKSAIMVFDVEAAVAATPAAVAPLSELEEMELQMDAVANEMMDKMGAVQDLMPQMDGLLEAADRVKESADAAAAAAEKAETKVESLIERNNKQPVSLWVGTKAEYDAITQKDESRLYLISDESLNDFSNPYNLLDNSDFTTFINQRGYAYRNINKDTRDYVMDRWICYTNVEFPWINVSPTAAGISKAFPDLDLFLEQRFPSGYLKNRLLTGVIYYDNGERVVDECTITSNVAYDCVRFRVTKVNNVVHLGLYEGAYTAETAPAYKPKGYAIELAECQRYYRYINSGALSGYTNNGGTELVVSIPFSFAKSPTCSCRGKGFKVHTVEGPVIDTENYPKEDILGAPSSCTFSGGLCFSKLTLKWKDGMKLATTGTPATLEIRMGAGYDNGIELSADY